MKAVVIHGEGFGDTRNDFPIMCLFVLICIHISCIYEIHLSLSLFLSHHLPKAILVLVRVGEDRVIHVRICWNHTPKDYVAWGGIQINRHVLSCQGRTDFAVALPTREAFGDLPRSDKLMK